MKVWWWTGGKPGNFGDILTPKFLDYFNIKYEFSSDFDTISIGSIAKVAKPNTTVLGSGFMSYKDQVCASANWVFVRGPYSREKIISGGGKCQAVYGDPALMLPLICNESTKEYDIGLIPHYSQYDRVVKEYPKSFVIDLRNDDPLYTAKQITKCRAVLSSSLHGIICAHAYGIPAAWVSFDSKIKGDGIKFKDYYSSVGLDPIQSSVSDPLFTTGQFKIDSIVDIFKGLK